MTTRKTIALTRQTFVGKVMSLLFNMLSRVVIDFLPRSKHLLISGLPSPSAVILECKDIVISPSICHEEMGPDTTILVFWMLSFKSAFSLSSFTFISRLFSYSSLSAIKVVSSAYMRLLILLPAILIPACATSSTAFCLMYSAYKLNKQGDNIQPWCTSFPIWNQSFVPCPALSVSSWPAYIFLRRQVRWSDILIAWRIFHRFLWSTRSKALVYSMKQVFFCNSLAFSLIQLMLAIWSLVPLPFLNLAWNIWELSVHILWSLTWRTFSITLLVCETSAIVW